MDVTVRVTSYPFFVSLNCNIRGEFVIAISDICTMRQVHDITSNRWASKTTIFILVASIDHTDV